MIDFSLLLLISHPLSGSTKCVPCSYLEYSAERSSSCKQCTTAPPDLAENSCLLKPHTGGQTTNLVSDSFSAPIRSFKLDEEGDLELSSSVNIPLVSDNKPFYIYSVVLVMTGVEYDYDCLLSISFFSEVAVVIIWWFNCSNFSFLVLQFTFSNFHHIALTNDSRRTTVP